MFLPKSLCSCVNILRGSTRPKICFPRTFFVLNNVQTAYIKRKSVQMCTFFVLNNVRTILISSNSDLLNTFFVQKFDKIVWKWVGTV